MQKTSVGISFKSQPTNFGSTKKTSENRFTINISNDEFAPSNKEKKKTIIASIIAGITAIFAAFKCKNIRKFFSKFFKTAEKEAGSAVDKTVEKVKPESVKPPEMKAPRVKPKIEFPEPNFTCGAENPEQFAREKRAYVDSIIKYADHTDKELNIKALNAIEKYGSHEDCEKLGNYLGKKDNELIAPFIKTITAIGKPFDDSFYLFSFIISPKKKLTMDIYRDVFKGIEKLGFNQVDYEYLPRTFNKVSESKDDELAKMLTETLCRVSTKDNIPELKKYADHKNPVVKECIAQIIDSVNKK